MSSTSLKKSNNAIVIGAGVNGLCSAIRLLESGWNVKIITDKISPDTTSDGTPSLISPLTTTGTAAIWEPFLSAPEDRVFQWAKDSFQAFKELRKDPRAGISMVSGFEYTAEPEYKVPKWLSLVEWRHAEPFEIPQGLKAGVHYHTMVMETPYFMPWLVNRFKSLGGSIELKKLHKLTEVLDHPFNPSLVVNCSGLDVNTHACNKGAEQLVGDKEMYPIRGQVVKVHAPWVHHFYTVVCDTEELAYLIPRSDCIVVGGTAQKGNWSTDTDEQITKQILERCERICPGISKAKILKVWTGLRPGRTSIRLEKEAIQHNNKQAFVIHNYGHGGSGMTLSWGCAKEVQQLAESCKSRELLLLKSKL